MILKRKIAFEGVKRQYWSIMYRAKKRVSRDVGLEFASLCSKYFLKSHHLHYGYWPAELKVDITNLAAAQENYTDLLISHIPDGVKKILDVGCGTGELARRLIDMGYHVDCVSPNPYLVEQARRLLGNKCRIYECFYEEMQTENRYDLILFSESFQYIDPEAAIKKSIDFLNKAGHILICDIFKKDTPDKSSLPGGHNLSTFYNIVSESPLESLEDLDITEQTAPTLDLENEVLKEIIEPGVNLGQRLLDDRYPFMSKLVRCLYRKKINKITEKYFGGEKTGENFKKFKSYRLMLYKKANPSNACLTDSEDNWGTTICSKSRGKISALTKIIGYERFGQVLKYLKKRKKIALFLTFAVVIVENILNGKKPHELFPSEEASFMAVIGVIFVVAGVFIRLLAQRHFDKTGFSTTGPYAIIRHPYYLGLFLIIAGVLFQLNGWLNWLVVLTSFSIFYGSAIACEEKSLQKRFGIRWKSYKADVPVIIPSVRRHLSLKRPRLWSWRAYSAIIEQKTSLVPLCLPLLIEVLMEDFIFEHIFGI